MCMSLSVENAGHWRSALTGSLLAAVHHSPQVVENAGHRGCVVLDLADGKKAQLKSLPGLLLGGERGELMRWLLIDLVLG